MKHRATQSQTKQFIGLFAFVAISFSSLSLFADAGKSLFVYGKVQLKDTMGETRSLAKGMSFDSGDTVITGINGRTQLRMTDGAVFDLKPNTEFLIESYQYKTSAYQGRNVASDDSKGFYKLLRGGFRAISGAIGKKNKKNYKVTTPVATIGIRGTDYTVQFCEADCLSNGLFTKDGLYVSVLDGGVILDNAAGSLDVEPGQAGFVEDVNIIPVLTNVVVKAAQSDDEQEASASLLAREAMDDDGNTVSIEAGVLPDAPVAINGRAAFSGNNQVNSDLTNVVIDESGALDQFTSNDSTYDRASAGFANRGNDNATGLYWGRWANGSATASSGDETTAIDLNNSSLHWIHASNQIKPELPLTGTANFTLVGNTNPTDNFGNRGVLGSANLSADFTNQTVDADVNLSINNQTWDAQANDVALDGAAASFAGNFDTVTVTSNDTGRQHNGEGSLAGFFSGDDDGALSGAGLTYTLEDGESTVDGSAAFEINTDSESPTP